MTWESVEYKLRHLAYRCIFKSTYTTYIASGPMLGQDQDRLLLYKRLKIELLIKSNLIDIQLYMFLIYIIPSFTSWCLCVLMHNLGVSEPCVYS